MTDTNNPLLIGKGLPPFDQIQPEQIVPGITQLLAELETELHQLEQNLKPTWTGLVEPLTRIEERLNWSWGIVSHLMGVKNSPELRSAYETIQPQIIRFSNLLSQSQAIYQGFQALENGESWSTLESAQTRIVEAYLRDAQLAGVGLVGEKRERFNEIQLNLGELATKFANNVLDATQAFKLKLTKPEEVTGLPPSLLSLAAQTARSAGEENATPEGGPWVITLDYPSYIPFMKYSSRPELRESSIKPPLVVLLQGNGIITPLFSKF